MLQFKKVPISFIEYPFNHGFIMALSKTILFLVLGVVSFAAADNCAQDK
jgi:hypothetical protein